MAVRELLRMGDARLRRVAQPVQQFDTPELWSLLQDMRDTMAQAQGAGLAAPQIGVDLQVVIFGTGVVVPRYPDDPAIEPTVLINPVLEPLGSEESLGWEGCLSVPGLRGEVPRWTRLRYQGFDPYGRAIDRTVSGFHARVVQHEVDHLLGVLYVQRMRDLSRLGFTDILFPNVQDAADD